MLPDLKNTGDTVRRTMFPVLNFFTMVYLDDIIICFKNYKEYMFYLNKLCNRNRYGNQEYKEKHQAEHELFKDLWKTPYAMFSSERNYDIFS